MTQQQALAILKTGANVFLTGEPGSGKTFTVDKYIKYLRQHKINVAVTASTGIAATHLGGMTIHSWSGIQIKKNLTPTDLQKLRGTSRLTSRAKKTSVLIIDEISMLDAQTLSVVNQAVCALRDSDQPFGGMQVVVVGDFFQLPPVNKGNDQQTQFAWQSPAWEAATPVVCYISEQHRQEDTAFLSILSAIRSNEISISVQEHLQSRIVTHHQPEVSTRLYSHNIDVDRVNEQKLKQLPGEAHQYQMTSKGAKPLVEQLKKSCLSPETLTLKKSASVMFTKNNFEMGFVNGTLGEVIGFKDGAPVVLTKDNRTITVPQMEWEVSDGTRVLAAISQFPLRLAWAITVHKSQGMTLDAAIMDLSQTFEYGQGYVAISRVRSLAGLHLLGINHQALQVHPQVIEIDNYFRKQSQIAINTLNNYSNQEMLAKHRNFILKCGGSLKKSALPAQAGPKDNRSTHEQTWDLYKQGKNIQEIAKHRGFVTSTIVNHLEILKQQNQLTTKELIKLIPKNLNEALPQIHQTFTDLGTDKLKPIFDKLKEKHSYENLRLARLVFEEK